MTQLRDEVAENFKRKSQSPDVTALKQCEPRSMHWKSTSSGDLEIMKMKTQAENSLDTEERIWKYHMLPDANSIVPFTWPSSPWTLLQPHRPTPFVLVVTRSSSNRNTYIVLERTYKKARKNKPSLLLENKYRRQIGGWRCKKLFKFASKTKIKIFGRLINLPLMEIPSANWQTSLQWQWKICPLLMTSVTWSHTEMNLASEINSWTFEHVLKCLFIVFKVCVNHTFVILNKNQLLILNKNQLRRKENNPRSHWVQRTTKPEPHIRDGSELLCETNTVLNTKARISHVMIMIMIKTIIRRNDVSPFAMISGNLNLVKDSGECNNQWEDVLKMNFSGRISEFISQQIPASSWKTKQPIAGREGKEGADWLGRFRKLLPSLGPSFRNNKFVQEDRQSLGVTHDKASDVKSTRRLVQKPELLTRLWWFQFLEGKKPGKPIFANDVRRQE